MILQFLLVPVMVLAIPLKFVFGAWYVIMMALSEGVQDETN